MRGRGALAAVVLAVLGALGGCVDPAVTGDGASAPKPAAKDEKAESRVAFAVIGDYGIDVNAAEHLDEGPVARLIGASAATFVVTVGDNNYFLPGTRESWDKTQGKYYAKFIKLPAWSAYGPGAKENNFFPALGNHDWDAGIDGYTEYFDLPGNERYYTFTRGPIQFFMLDSDAKREPDGVAAGSTQREWFRAEIGKSRATWKIVAFHHPCVTSTTDEHGPAAWMCDWDFEKLGVSAVLTGHNHHLERLEQGGIPYFVVGGSGNALYHLKTIHPASVFRTDRVHGYMLGEATETTLTLRLMDDTGKELDKRVVEKKK